MITNKPQLEQESRTQGGLYLPETAKEKPQQGLVVAVGDDDVRLRPPVPPPARRSYGSLRLYFIISSQVLHMFWLY
jgi:hypothetical protein